MRDNVFFSIFFDAGRVNLEKLFRYERGRRFIGFSYRKFIPAKGIWLSLHEWVSVLVGQREGRCGGHGAHCREHRQVVAVRGGENYEAQFGCGVLIVIADEKGA